MRALKEPAAGEYLQIKAIIYIEITLYVQSIYGYCGTGDAYCGESQCDYGDCPNGSAPPPHTEPDCVVYLVKPYFCGTFAPISDGPSCLSSVAACYIEVTSLKQQLDDITSGEGEVDSGTLGVGAYDKLDILADVCQKMYDFCLVVADYRLPS
jgi:hypothetical protein